MAEAICISRDHNKKFNPILSLHYFISLAFILIFCLCGTNTVYAQHNLDSVTPGVRGSGNPKDTTESGRFRGAEAKNEKYRHKRPGVILYRGKIERRKFDSTLFTSASDPTTGDYLENLEKVFQMLSDVPAITSSFSRLDEIHEQFDQEDSAIDILKERVMTLDQRTLNIRNLQMYNTLLDALEKRTSLYAADLKEYDEKMDGIKAKIEGLKKDTLMLRIFRDSTLKATFEQQLLDIRDKWRQADSLIKLNVGEIDDLNARASANAITISDLSYRVDIELRQVGNKAFGKERKYLWEPGPSEVETNGSSQNAFLQPVESEKKLVKYYFANSHNNRIWLFLSGLIFFGWISFNFYTLKRLNDLQSIERFQFRFVHPWPVSASLLFIFSLAPLFDLHAPAIYIESIQFLLMVLLTVILRKRIPANLFYGWCIFILLFLLLSVPRILGLPISTQRWTILMQNILSVVFGLLFLFGWKIKRLDRLFGSSASFVAAGEKTPGSIRVLFYAGGLYVFLNLLALICNLFGRVTLMGIFTATAIYAFAQTVSLVVFVHLILETFLLQIQTSRVRKKYPAFFDASIVTRSIYRFATVLAIVLWVIVFTTNLNLFDGITDFLTSLFNDTRQVGSFQFTLGGILLFMAIIWTANFLQRYITYFFGDTGDDAAIDDKGQRSKLLVTRLILLTGGFLLAVAASGLPMDRITVVLGALGVGIGLGLQSIVNNFVSGVILIFDRPLRIGDMVEIGDKKGKVKEIGIRSSTLLTDEGAEVIIPNGDVLSHNIVNWTLSNNHVRAALSFTVEKSDHTDAIQSEEIKKIIKANPNVLEGRDPDIIQSNISSKTLEIKIFFWCKNFDKTTTTSIEIRDAIYQYLDSQGVVVE